MTDMKRTFVLTTFLLLILTTAGAQSIWDKAHLAQVKEGLGQAAYAAAYRSLIREADRQLTQTPLSVMMKEKTAVSGDKHDYLSLSRYFWPDPTKKTDCPM